MITLNPQILQIVARFAEHPELSESCAYAAGVLDGLKIAAGENPAITAALRAIAFSQFEFLDRTDAGRCFAFLLQELVADLKPVPTPDAIE